MDAPVFHYQTNPFLNLLTVFPIVHSSRLSFDASYNCSTAFLSVTVLLYGRSYKNSRKTHLGAFLNEFFGYWKNSTGSTGSPSFCSAKYRLLPSNAKYFVGSLTNPIVLPIST